MRAVHIDCIARVDGKVHDHLLKLLRVGAHRTQIAVVLDEIVDLFADEPFDERSHLADHIGQLQDFRTQRLLTREGEQLPRQRGRAVRVCANLLDVVIVAVARRMTQQHKVARADDRGQHVVEVMRNAACKLAHGLHLGRLRHLAFELRLFRGIGKAEKHRRLAKPAHPDEPHRDGFIGRCRQAHRHIAPVGWPSAITAHCIGKRALVFAHDEVGGKGGKLPFPAPDRA